jgi:hypothetical protein
METYKDIALEECKKVALPELTELQINRLVFEAKNKYITSSYTLLGLVSGQIVDIIKDNKDETISEKEIYDQCLLALNEAVDIFDETSNFSFIDVFKYCVQGKIIALVLNAKNAKLRLNMENEKAKITIE